MNLFNKFSIRQLTKPGFTLVEVLVSATILSIILVIVFSTLWSGLKVKKRSRKIAQRYMGARIVLDFMSREFREAFAFNYPTDGPIQNFKWEPAVPNSDQIEKRVSYWGVYTDGGVQLSYPGLSPIARESFYVKKEDDKKIIYRKEVPVWPMNNLRTIKGPVMEGEFDLEVVYPADRTHPDGNKWKLPVKIIIYITIDDEEGQKKELVRNVYLPQYKKE